jgi:hypothetical protein
MKAIALLYLSVYFFILIPVRNLVAVLFSGYSLPPLLSSILLSSRFRDSFVA